MFDAALTHDDVASFVQTKQSTESTGMGIYKDRQTIGDDWGDRMVWWLRQAYVNWPIKAVARAVEEPESVVKSWWAGEARPDRRKLQKLAARYPQSHSFVFGRPSKQEITARLDALNDNIRELKALVNELDQAAARPPSAGNR